MMKACLLRTAYVVRSSTVYTRRAVILSADTVSVNW